MISPLLTPHQQAVADRVLDEEERSREHLVVSLSGAHAYGFPSPDSDLDLKAIHIAPSAALLALSPARDRAERLEVIDGVEIDYSSNEIHAALIGILQGNGNFIERVLAPTALRSGPELAALRPLIRGALSKQLHRHYRGFATGQLREWEKGGRRSAKRLLYVLRTTLTGTHALLTGEIVPDVTALLDTYGFPEARALIEAKRLGEKMELEPEVAEVWRARIARAFEVLEQAAVRSILPEEAPNAEALEAWLLEARRARLRAR